MKFGPALMAQAERLAGFTSDAPRIVIEQFEEIHTFEKTLRPGPSTLVFVPEVSPLADETAMGASVNSSCAIRQIIRQIEVTRRAIPS